MINLLKHIKKLKKLKTPLKLKVVSMVKIGIIMGSKSDYPIMKEATEILDEFGISYETEIVSAHRTPEKMMDYSKNAHKRGIKVIIAGAGGAAHLPGMVASNSPLPLSLIHI